MACVICQVYSRRQLLYSEVSTKTSGIKNMSSDSHYLVLGRRASGRVLLTRREFSPTFRGVLRFNNNKYLSPHRLSL